MKRRKGWLWKLSQAMDTCEQHALWCDQLEEKRSAANWRRMQKELRAIIVAVVGESASKKEDAGT